MDVKPPLLSCARWSDPFVTAFVIVALYAVLSAKPISTNILAFILFAGVALQQSAIELMYAPWCGTPIPAVPFRLTLMRAGVKWLGIMTGLALMLAAWWCLPEYHLERYHSLWQMMPLVLPFVPFVIAVFVLFTEWRLGPQEDYTWHWGLMTLGRWQEVDLRQIRLGLFGWLIRGFFLTANYSALTNSLGHVRNTHIPILTAPWPQQVYMITAVIYVALIAAITPGYVFSSRLLGTSLKKVDQSWFGWGVTAICYHPFMDSVFQRVVNFHAYAPHPGWMTPWTQLLFDLPAGSYMVGTAIILLECIHYWGEAIMGIRASNLANRGVITNGPFRLCKHPVYLAKCIAWGLIWMPFAAGATLPECVRLTVLYTGVCGVFFMRSWVEERLFSTDPAYVAYATWMDEHGLFARLGKRFAPLSFGWRLQRWSKMQLPQ
jgi:hypothetical protein